VTFNPTPAAASGGPSGGAWVGLWNEYNRRSVTLAEQDSKTSWTYGTASWEPSDGGSSNVKNRATIVTGAAEDSATATFICSISTNSGDPGSIGIGINSTTAISGVSAGSESASGNAYATGVTAQVGFIPALGLSFIQAMEFGNTVGTVTYYGTGVVNSPGQTHQLGVIWTY
jgi:hypothetical protein